MTGLQLPDVRLLQTMAYLMPDFSWPRTNDDWDAPMRLGFSGETSIRLDSRQRLWLVKGPEMTLDDIRERPDHRAPRSDLAQSLYAAGCRQADGIAWLGPGPVAYGG